MAIQVVHFLYYIRKTIYNKYLFPINVTKFMFSKSYGNKILKITEILFYPTVY